MGWSPSDVLSLIGSLIQSGLIEALIKTFESFFKQSTGVQKKERVMDLIMQEIPAAAKPIVSAAVDAVVKEYNEKGLFQHSSSPASGGEGAPSGSGSNSRFAR